MENVVKYLIVVAHPDDEVISFGMLLQRLALEGSITVCCVTHGNTKRKDYFISALNFLCYSSNKIIFDFQDKYENRLPVKEIAEKLRQLGEFNIIYTHHSCDQHWHHQDVAMACRLAFPNTKILCPSMDCLSSNIISDKKFLDKKVECINRFYYLELTNGNITEGFHAANMSIECFSECNNIERQYYFNLARNNESCINLENIDDPYCYESSPYEIKRLQLLGNFIKSAIRKYNIKSVVEFGSHEGEVTKFICDTCQVTCVEPNIAYLDKAKNRLGKRKNIKFIQGFFDSDTARKFSGEDLMIACDVLYYLPCGLKEGFKEVYNNCLNKYILISNDPGDATLSSVIAPEENKNGVLLNRLILKESITFTARIELEPVFCIRYGGGYALYERIY